MNLRKKLALAGAGLLAIAGVVIPATMAQAAQSCNVTYTAGPWTEGPGVGGFTANLTVTNTGDPWAGWTLTFTLPSGQSLGAGWSATWSASGQNVSAVPLDWNRNIGTNGNTSIGFNGRWTGSFSGNPTNFAVNGVACNGGGGGNQAPSVALTSPTAGSSFASGSPIPLAATASDPDGTINRVEFLVDGALVGTDTSSPYSFSATGVAVGNHTAAARAVDNGNPAASTTTSAVSFSVTGTQTPSIVLSPASLSVNEGSSAPLSVKLSQAPTANVTVSLSRTGDSSVSVPASVTLTTANWNTGVNATVAAAEDADQLNGTATVSASATGYTGAQVAVSVLDNDVVHVDNPYAGARGYVNPEWKALAQAEPGGSRVMNNSTGVWLDAIVAIAGRTGKMGLRAHLDAALAQFNAGTGPLVAQFVIYDLPNRDCSALASNGELKVSENGIARYKTEYIDPIAAIMADPKYAPLRISTVIELDSLPNLITNLNLPLCAEAQSSGAYVQGIQYALNKLHAISNVYTYLDAAHHGWIGWSPNNFGPTADLLASTAEGTTAHKASVDGFIVNTANYSALSETNFSITTTVNGQSVRQSKWVDFNDYIDELIFAQAFRNRLIQAGFASNIGMLIDTSRNGWGSCVVSPCQPIQTTRPTAPSTSTDLNTFVNESRIDRRIHAGNWCNQAGAGLGERPRANPASGIDAYVWIKPPGESDGSSTAIPNSEGKGFDRMCDPTYDGNERNGMSKTGALPNSPISGAWFSAQFQQLMANAFPPLS
jgi:cellulose 1,4-beta-cellobiosidase